MFAVPSGIMDLPGLPHSSFFSEEVHFPGERQVGFWKTDSRADHSGDNSVASFPLEKRIPVSSQMAKSFDHPDPYLISLEKHVGGAERTFSHSLPRHLDHDSSRRSNVNAELTSYMVEGEKLNIVGGRHENGLFSSSLSELFTRKLRLSSNNAVYGHSVGAAACQYKEEEPFESVEENEVQTIGNLLPDDDDLFSGVTDGLDCMGRPLGGDDTEDLDLFSSVGGMDLGEDNSSPGQRNSELLGGNTNGQLGGGGSIAGGYPFGEHPSRTLFVRNINSNVEDSELRALFEQYGNIRTLYTACKHRGFVMISYYDIRAARNAMKALQNKPLRHRKFDIHFSIPKDNPSDKDINQGTVVVFNLDSSVSNDELHQIFGVYGEIKEVRETPHRSHHKFIEFYDVRAAESALCALNRSDIAGKTIKVEPGHPGGAKCSTQPFSLETELDDAGAYMQQGSPTNNLTTNFSGPISHGGVTSCSMDNGIIFGANSATRTPISSFPENTFHQNTSSSVPSSLPSLLRMESFRNQSNATESGHSQGQPKLEFMGFPNFHPHSLPEYHEIFSSGAPFNSLGNLSSAKYSVRPPEQTESRQFSRLGSNGNSVELNEVFGPAGNGSCHPPGHHYVWSNSHHSQPQGMMWPNSPSFVNGICSTPPHKRMHAVPRAPSNMLNTLLPVSNHHVGSALSVNPSIWDRRHAYAGESPDASVFHPGSLGNMRISGNSPHPLEFVPPNIFPHVGGNCMDIPIASKNVGLHSHNQRCVMFPARSQMIPMMNSFDSPNERNKIRRNEGSSNQADNKKQFELDIDRIMRGEDNRTTLMIKNIPNKYTSKMLLAAIDERHRGTYDFIYLPIDFKNKCNVGYAFINMIDPSLIIPFYQAFNGKKWEKFNSEKVASLAYARIQGKAALIAHFQNSSLMNEDKRCRPILFHTDGPNAGDQVPFPMGVNVRTRPSKIRASTTEENHLDSQGNSTNGEECSNGDSSSGSARELA